MGRGPTGRASPNDRITLEGIGKTPADLRAAVRAAADGDPLRWVAVESPEELEALAGLARRAGARRSRRAAGSTSSCRLNPDVAPETHAGLAVGRGAVEVRHDRDRARRTTVAAIPDGGPLASRGIHLHVGSQLGAVDAWRDAVRRGLALLALVGAGREGFDTLDVGGGFPVGEPGTVPDARALRARAAGAARRAPAPTGGRRASPSSPAGSSSRGPAGSWRACSTCASAPTRSAWSSWTPA